MLHLTRPYECLAYESLTSCTHVRWDTVRETGMETQWEAVGEGRLVAGLTIAASAATGTSAATRGAWGAAAAAAAAAVPRGNRAAVAGGASVVLHWLLRCSFTTSS